MSEMPLRTRVDIGLVKMGERDLTCRQPPECYGMLLLRRVCCCFSFVCPSG